jgi:hypothetical protein
VTPVYDFVDDLKPIFDNDLITLLAVMPAKRCERAIFVYRYKGRG